MKVFEDKMLERESLTSWESSTLVLMDWFRGLGRHLPPGDRVDCRAQVAGPRLPRWVCVASGLLPGKSDTLYGCAFHCFTAHSLHRWVPPPPLRR